MSRKPPSRAARFFALGLLASTFSVHAFSSTTDTVPYHSEIGLTPHNTAAVVFSGGPGRIREGMEMYMNGEVDHLLLSGVHKSLTPEKILNTMKIPVTRDLSGITLDYTSQTTEQNAQATAQWMRQIRVPGIVLITSAEHMPRAIMNLEKLGSRTTQLYTKAVNTPISPWAIMRERAKGIATRMGLSSLGAPVNRL